VWFDKLEKELIAKKYSKRTIKFYLHYNRELLKLSKKTLCKVSNNDVRDYLYYLAEKKIFPASTLNTAINALKFQFITFVIVLPRTYWKAA
jgi:site-specific recombinase XerD